MRPQDDCPQIAFERVRLDRKPALAQLLELYRYDTSDLDALDSDPLTARYGYAYLDHYWTEPDRFAFFIRVGPPGVTGLANLAGFVLINRFNPAARLGDERAVWSIAEFFVLRKYRRRGIGTAAARHAFDHFPGLWAVCQTKQNTAAQAFWDRVIDGYPHHARDVRWLQHGADEMRVIYFRNDPEHPVTVAQHVWP